MTPADSLDDLFVRYWDHALTAAEADALDARLRTDPAARDRFQAFCLQVVAVADGRAVAPEPVQPRRRWWSVRRAVVAAAALAACVALAVGWLVWDRQQSDTGTVALRSSGTVRIRAGVGPELDVAGRSLSFGDTVSTHGLGSSAELTFPDGSLVVLMGNAAATVGSGKRVTLLRGAVAAEIQPGRGAGSFIVATPEAAARAGAAGARLVVERSPQGTELGVLQGNVTVSRPEGDRLLDMTGGEGGTVAVSGVVQKGPLQSPPNDYAWDLTQPLPAGWEVGALVDEADRPAVRADFWHDPALGFPAAQVRSNKDWVRGLFLLRPDSVVRARYRVDRPGRLQFLIVVRPDPPAGPYAVVLDRMVNLPATPPGEWADLEWRAADLRPLAPLTFGPPWVGYSVVFNTFDKDLGLRVSDFRVVGPAP